MSSSLGNPPAVTSDAKVNVQYDSLLFVGAMVGFYSFAVSKGRDSLPTNLLTAMAMSQ